MVKLSGLITGDQNLFEELMTYFFDNDYRLNQRSAWVLSHCCNKNPELIKPYIEDIIHNLSRDIPVAVKRNSVRILQFVDIPKDMSGDLAEQCFTFLNDQTEPVAVQVFAMTVLFNITKNFPALKTELRYVIENKMPYGSPGFVSRGRKILKNLDKIS